ncbi:hypothetical protein AAON49_03035 [Pseudotenacibaculum sp. MALMAid0570]|uniref:hypothetical protein n=1 Tax=Pseudotenacibaculum sp. MALMAid0570 TaxID=3143938 RepID=UPI0032DEC58A
MSSEKKVLASKSDEATQTLKTDSQKIVHRSNLVQFLHPEKWYKKGEEWQDRYYHIMTPETQRCGEMYRYELRGYSYGIGRPLWITWVGYLYADAPSKEHLIYKGHSQVNLPSDVPTVRASQYIGSNGHLYLMIGPISQYYNSFNLNYHSGSTGERVVHKKEKYKVFVTKSAKPI